MLCYHVQAKGFIQLDELHYAGSHGQDIQLVSHCLLLQYLSVVYLFILEASITPDSAHGYIQPYLRVNYTCSTRTCSELTEPYIN